MTHALEEAAALIQKALSSTFVGLDVWRPAAESLPEWLGVEIGDSLQLLGDDGSFLVAVLVLPSSAREGESRGAAEQAITDRLRRVGNFLRAGAADCGIHRLVEVLLLPENAHVRELALAVAGAARADEGRFRVVVLAALDNEHLAEQIVQQIAALGPLPSGRILEPVRESALVGHIPAVLGDACADAEAVGAIAGDIAGYLREGHWPSEGAWLAARELVRSIAADAKEGQA